MASKRFQYIDRTSGLWPVIFDTINENYRKVIYALNYEGKRHIVEVFDVRNHNNRLFELKRDYLEGRNHLSVYIDGVRQNLNRDFLELSQDTFEVSDGLLQYRSVVYAVYEYQKEFPADSILSEDILSEYVEATGDYDSPKDRVLSEIQNIIRDIYHENDLTRDRVDLYIQGVDTANFSADYLNDKVDNFKYDNYPPGEYYLTPTVTKEGVIRWKASQNKIDTPRAQKFARSGAVDPNAIFIGNDRGRVTPIVGYGFIVHDENEVDPHYEDMVPIAYGGTERDNGLSGNVTGMLVMDRNNRALNGASPQLLGAAYNTSERPSRYDPGYNSGVVPIEAGGTGFESLVDLQNYIRGNNSTAKISLESVSNVNYLKISSNLSHYKSFVGQEYTILMNSPIYGDSGEVKVVIVGMNYETSKNDNPTFTLMPTRVLAYTSLTGSTSAKYIPYNKLNELHNCLARIYNNFPKYLRDRMKLSQNKYFDDISKRKDNIKFRLGLINPYNASKNFYKNTIDDQYLWLLSIGEVDDGNIDLCYGSNYYHYFTDSAVDKIMGILDSSNGLWTRSQALTEDSAMYYAYDHSGDAVPHYTSEILGIAPLFCV